MAEQNNTPETETTEETPNRGSGNTRLPFGLCMRYGIAIGDDWTPRDAWNALKGKGVTPEKVYEKLSKKEKAKADTGAAPEEKPEVKLNRLETGDISEETWGQIDKAVYDISKRFGYKADIDVDTKTRSAITLAAASINDEGNLTLHVGNENFGRGSEKAKAEYDYAYKSGWHSAPADEGYAKAVIDHEMGHFLTYEILGTDNMIGAIEYTNNDNPYSFFHENKKYNTFRSRAKFEYLWDRGLKDVILETFDEMKKQGVVIPKTIKPWGAYGAERAPNISGYGKTNWFEWLAEGFCNGLSSAANPVGKAVVTVFERRMKKK